MPQLKVRYLGLDVHKDSIVIAVAEQGRSAAFDVGKFPSDWESLQKELEKLAKGFTLKLCYEAGPTGFELQRRLVEAGYDSQVIAPSLIPTKPGDRIKTDNRDAKKLATCLRAGVLTPVYVPDADTEALRDLERARRRRMPRRHASISSASFCCDTGVAGSYRTGRSGTWRGFESRSSNRRLSDACCVIILRLWRTRPSVSKH